MQQAGCPTEARSQPAAHPLARCCCLAAAASAISMEEHVLYGHCLDGGCCNRSHLERAMKRKLKAKAAAAPRRGRREALGEDTSAAGTRSKSALHYAAMKNKLDVVHQLLLSGANINAVDEEGSTPLALACAAGHVRVTQRLLVNAQYPLVSKRGFVTRRHPPGTNVVDDHGRTPLHHAAKEGHHVIVKLLLEAGGNAEVLDHDGRTALDVCTSPQAFHLLRSRAEIYNRRERLAGVILKRDLINSTEEEELRTETTRHAGVLYDEVRALGKTKDIIAERVKRVDSSLLNYKACGALEHNSRRLKLDAELTGKHLLELCLDKKAAPTIELLTLPYKTLLGVEN